MITVMIHATVKKEKLDEFLELAALMTRETRGKREGCISYSFNQNTEKPTDFVLYEQWESQDLLDKHIQELCTLLGPPMPGYPLPKKLLDMYEKAEPVFYNPIA